MKDMMNKYSNDAKDLVKNTNGMLYSLKWLIEENTRLEGCISQQRKELLAYERMREGAQALYDRIAELEKSLKIANKPCLRCMQLRERQLAEEQEAEREAEFDGRRILVPVKNYPPPEEERKAPFFKDDEPEYRPRPIIGMARDDSPFQEAVEESDANMCRCNNEHGHISHANTVNIFNGEINDSVVFQDD